MNSTVPEVGRAEYLSVAATAKLVRKALADAFPAYKFSVRSNSYAGGASIDVGWYDGPPEPVIDAVVHAFAGSGFDGMIDLKYYKQSWLMPDGTACLAESPGTQNSAGMDPEVIVDPPHPSARLVHFGADYVFCKRTLTAEADALIKRKTAERRPWYSDADDYEKGRLEHQVGQRWLFPPCEFTYTVGYYGRDREFVVEAEGFTSKTAAAKKAAELQKARNPRGFRYVHLQRKGHQR